MVQKHYMFLFLIILLAGFLRFFELGINPPSLTWDEVAWGYNAYSLSLEGRDEFGKFLPFQYLESFGDFKPPVYAYLSIIPVKLFGLNELAVRFPSAFFGTLTVLITYFLVTRIFEKDSIALASAFLLAISPWHINLSRAAFEANVASFFIVAGVWLFLESVKGKRWHIVFSAIFFCLSLYTFNSARVVSPLLVLILCIGFQKKLWQIKKQTIVAIFIGIIMVAPIAKFLLSPQANLRFQEVNIFSDIGVIKQINQEIENDGNTWWAKIVHNRRIVFAVSYANHYLDNLSPDFLFIKGDGNPKFSTQDVGQLYLWELPFFVGGIFFLLKKRPANWWIVPAWLLIGIIPAAVARETPHALRIETTLPTFQIFTAFGIASFTYWIKSLALKKNTKNSIFLFTFFLLLFNVTYYYHGYYTHYKREFSSEWQYGYREAILFSKSVQSQYEHIYITNALGRPYIYVLFYTQYDPKLFRKEAIIDREALGFVHIREFGKYLFDKKENLTKEKTLYIEAPSEVPSNASILQKFFYLDGKESLVAYTL